MSLLWRYMTINPHCDIIDFPSQAFIGALYNTPRTVMLSGGVPVNYGGAVIQASVTSRDEFETTSPELVGKHLSPVNTGTYYAPTVSEVMRPSCMRLPYNATCAIEAYAEAGSKPDGNHDYLIRCFFETKTVFHFFDYRRKPFIFDINKNVCSADAAGVITKGVVNPYDYQLLAGSSRDPSRSLSYFCNVSWTAQVEDANKILRVKLLSESGRHQAHLVMGNRTGNESVAWFEALDGVEIFSATEPFAAYGIVTCAAPIVKNVVVNATADVMANSVYLGPQDGWSDSYTHTILRLKTNADFWDGDTESLGAYHDLTVYDGDPEGYFHAYRRLYESNGYAWDTSQPLGYPNLSSIFVMGTDQQ